jgi:two-component system sensor histidine kinase/response regulator
VITAQNGIEAVQRTKEHLPDIILLDVMMPDMDGIEVCHRLQADPNTRRIPVIFVTARAAKESKIEGLAAGAVDYITKPIDLDVTVARIQTQLRFVEINRQVSDLQSRLEEARMAATVGAVSQGIAHNLNNLLGVVMGYTDLIKAAYDKPLMVKKNVQHVEDAVQRIVNILKQLGTLTLRSRPPLERYRLSSLLASSVQRFRSEFKIDAPISIENPLGDIEIESNIEAFEEIITAILINAWEAYDGDTRPISIHTRSFEKNLEGLCVEIQIVDRGRGVDPEIKDRMFEPFMGSKHTAGVGMGLTIARHALRNFGGDIALVARQEGGTSAVIVHPVQRKVRREELS